MTTVKKEYVCFFGLCIIVVISIYLLFTSTRGFIDGSHKDIYGKTQQSLPQIKQYQQTNYSILSGALPDFINDTMFMSGSNPVVVPNGWGYIFQLVVSTALWRRLNFHTIVAITVDYKHVTPASLRLMKYVDGVLKSLNATVVYFDTPSHMKVRLSQALRIAVGQLYFVGNNDALFTDDSDMWPMGASRYVIPAGKSIYVANALCCGNFPHFNKHGVYTFYREYPMSSIGMFGRTWKAVYGKLIDGFPDSSTNIYSFESLKPLIQRLEKFASVAKIKNIYTSNHGGRGWHLDQQLASKEIEEYVHENGRKHLAYQTNYTCMTVHLGRGWKHYWDNRNKCINTVHFGSYRPWDKGTWKLARIIFAKFFSSNSSIVVFLEKYRDNFKSLLRN